MDHSPLTTHPTSEIITRIQAREVLDSRGNPTLEVEVYCRDAWGRAIVPSGASTGKYEAHELRDGDPHWYAGKGVLKARNHVHEIIGPKLIGWAADRQADIDRFLCELDGTPDKSRLGANAILGVSLACAHAAAAVRGLPLWRYLDTAGKACLPLPMVNMISGGLHAGHNLQVQDFLVIPLGIHEYRRALETVVAVYRSLGAVLRRHGLERCLVGDEGGYGPRLSANEQALDLLMEAIDKAGLVPGKDAGLALDIASSHFFHDGKYELDRGEKVDSGALSARLERWVDRYPILSIEDGMAEDDWQGWKQLTAALGQRVQLIGDDLFVTHPDRLRRGIAEGVANSILIKVNQIGTLTEALEVIALARSAGYRPVISARSGETEDTTIADLAVATAAGQIKVGSVARGERLAKYNQLLRIEEEMGAEARLAEWIRQNNPTTRLS